MPSKEKLLPLKHPIVTRETSKAIQVTVNYRYKSAMEGWQEDSAGIWLPKSQVEFHNNDVSASAWILEQKELELSKLHDDMLVEILVYA